MSNKKYRSYAEFLAPFCMEYDKSLVVLLMEVPIEGLIVYLGSLGDYVFHQTMYAYVGATFDENVEKRRKSLWRWRKSHIEYFLSNPFIRITGRCCRPADDNLTIHNVAGRMRWYGVAVKGFEVYDCNCESHLVRVENTYGLLEELANLGFKCFLGNDALKNVGNEIIDFLNKRMKNAEKAYGLLYKQFFGSGERNDLSP
ncbi:MAG: DUF123 domain-containing protein [Fervidicoccaceae archaeon]|jgi:Uri superfamily endonuclease